MDTINSMKKTLGERIREQRILMQMTQEELATVTGLSTQTISTAENGRKALRPENIVKLSQALEVTTDYLLTGKADPQPDYTILNQKLVGVDAKMYARIMRMIEIMLETD